MNTASKPFEISMQENERVLRNYAIQLTQNIEDANDLVQETFLKTILYSLKIK